VQAFINTARKIYEKIEQGVFDVTNEVCPQKFLLQHSGAHEFLTSTKEAATVRGWFCSGVTAEDSSFIILGYGDRPRPFGYWASIMSNYLRLFIRYSEAKVIVCAVVRDQSGVRSGRRGQRRHCTARGSASSPQI
jgi:hypothetical protein